MTDTMQPTQELNEAQRFFFDHAGYSWNAQAGETPEHGRTRCAIDLELAERVIKARMDAEESISFVWEEDPDIDSSDHDHPDEEDHEPYALWQCCLMVDGCVAEAMGGVDFGRDGSPMGDPYGRVAEAQLAEQWLAYADSREPELSESCSFTRQQQAAILAGLRMLQQALHGEAVTVPDHTLTDGGALEPIDVCGIDSLCEMVNHL